MSRKPITNVLVLSTALMIGAGPYLVRAAGVRANGDVTANIDLQRVFAESEARNAAEVKITDYGKLMKAKFDEVDSQPYLTPQEMKEYSDALNAENPGAAEKAKIAALKSNASKRGDDYRALTNKKEADLTAADKTRLRDLADIPKQHQAVLAQLERFYQQLVNAEDAKLTREALGEVRAAVAKLARDQGITQVYDTSCLVYSQVDLTPAALLKVARKKAPKP